MIHIETLPLKLTVQLPRQRLFSQECTRGESSIALAKFRRTRQLVSELGRTKDQPIISACAELALFDDVLWEARDCLEFTKKELELTQISGKQPHLLVSAGN